MDVMRNPGEAPAAAAVLRHADEGSRLEILGARYVFKAKSAETAGSFCCFGVREWLIVMVSAGLEGLYGIGLGGYFCGPRGLRHALRKGGAEEVRLLGFGLPGVGLEAMLREMDAAGRGGEPSIATIVAIAA